MHNFNLNMHLLRVGLGAAELGDMQVRCEPWPNDVKLFQPLETEQILLPDNCNCLTLKTFLRMCNLKYEIVFRKNAEDMSPTGRVPFIQYGEILISELVSFIRYLTDKTGITLTSDLDNLQLSDMRAYMAYVTSVLACAENYIAWLDNETFHKVTLPHYSSVHPWPLGWIVTQQKRKQVFSWLRAQKWNKKSLREVYDVVNICFKALSERLGNTKYFFGDNPTELDALVFGHVSTILATSLPSDQFVSTIRSYPNIVDHCQRVEQADYTISLSLPPNNN